MAARFEVATYRRGSPAEPLRHPCLDLGMADFVAAQDCGAKVPIVILTLRNQFQALFHAKCRTDFSEDRPTFPGLPRSCSSRESGANNKLTFLIGVEKPNPKRAGNSRINHAVR
jgi:hypothetical protein